MGAQASRLYSKKINADEMSALPCQSYGQVMITIYQTILLSAIALCFLIYVVLSVVRHIRKRKNSGAFQTYNSIDLLLDSVLYAQFMLLLLLFDTDFLSTEFGRYSFEIMLIACASQCIYYVICPKKTIDKLDQGGLNNPISLDLAGKNSRFVITPVIPNAIW